jgi:hypothetical protein
MVVLKPFHGNSTEELPLNEHKHCLFLFEIAKPYLMEFFGTINDSFLYSARILLACLV